MTKKICVFNLDDFDQCEDYKVHSYDMEQVVRILKRLTLYSRETTLSKNSKKIYYKVDEYTAKHYDYKSEKDFINGVLCAVMHWGDDD